jgi:hypothetical protein
MSGYPKFVIAADGRHVYGNVYVSRSVPHKAEPMECEPTMRFNDYLAARRTLFGY